MKPNTDFVIWEAEFMGKKREKRWLWDSSNPKGRENTYHLERIPTRNRTLHLRHEKKRKKETEQNPKTIERGLGEWELLLLFI
jgi:hypothetical protein